MIEAIELTSRSRGRTGGGSRQRQPVVDRVSFDVYPGQVTALLGAPGVGKSAVLRMMTEQQRAKGRTLFNGRPYRALRPAVREVGLALNPEAVHPGRTVRHHLALYSAAGGVAKSRIDEVLEIGGLTLQADARCGHLDSGQKQRLAIAAALLGDPAALLLDEPHVLDAHGLTWFNALIRAYAAQGRTVLVAASDPEAIAESADHVVVLRRDEEDGRTRVAASRSATEVLDGRRLGTIMVRSPQAARLATVLEADGATLVAAGPGVLKVSAVDRARVGELAHAAGICLHELAEVDGDELLFGIKPPRTEVVPAPVAAVERCDLAPSAEARSRSGWRAGVRLIGAARGVALAEQPEDAVAVVGAVGAGAAAEQTETYVRSGVVTRPSTGTLVGSVSEQHRDLGAAAASGRDVVVAAGICAARSVERRELVAERDGFSGSGLAAPAVRSPEVVGATGSGPSPQRSVQAELDASCDMAFDEAEAVNPPAVDIAEQPTLVGTIASRSSVESPAVNETTARSEDYAVELAAAYAQAFVEGAPDSTEGLSTRDKLTPVVALTAAGALRPESEEASA